MQRVAFPETVASFGVVGPEEGMLFFQVLDDGRHQPGGKKGGIGLHPIGQQPLADERIPGEMNGLTGGFHHPFCGSRAGFGYARRAGGQAKRLPKTLRGKQRLADERLEARQGRNAGPDWQEEADVFAGEIHDLDGNLVARLQAGDFDQLQAGINLAAGGYRQAGPPLEIHAL